MSGPLPRHLLPDTAEVGADGLLRILYEQKSPNEFVIARGTMQQGKWVFKNLFEFSRVK